MRIMNHGGMSLPLLAVALALSTGLAVAAAQSEARLPAGSAEQRAPLEELKQKAAQGDAAAQADLGLLYYRGEGVPRDVEEGARWILRAAQQGHVEAQADVGQLYYRGEGIPRDFAQAAEWYRKAAGQGHARAQYNLAALYAAGEGVAKDLAWAVHWHRKAAALGLAEAQYALALLYLRGEGVPRDPAQADKWLRRAAEAGLPEAQASLAARLFRANKDSRAAAEWYRYAAEQGLARAQHILGLLLHKGWSGLPPDPVRGQMWLILAASDAGEDQHENYAQERDAAARGMKPEQAAEAQRLAHTWKPTTWEESSQQGAPPATANELVGTDDFFSTAGENISAAEVEYQTYWRRHIQESHRRILQAALLVPNPQRALVLGAGKCREIPLEGLARQFQHVVLVDLDGPSMRQAVLSIPEELRAKVEIRVSDVTSFAQPLMEATRQIVENAATAQEAFANLESRYAAIESQRHFPDLPAADLVVSSLVLSELPRYPSTYAVRLIEEKFQTPLSAWSGYGVVFKSLRSFTLQDHAELLARLCRPAGVVYYADTVARGPDLTRVSSAEKESALTALAGRFARLGLFQQLRTQPEAWMVFSRVFQAVREPGAASGERDGGSASLEQTIEAIERAPDSSLVPAAAVAEAASRMLCQRWLPAEMEVRAYEELVEAYERANPNALEQLVETDELLGDLAARGFTPVGSPESWWWLEYACSIPRKAGAFRVRSWILQPDP
jgi:TPR repeat protein